ncbi:MAG: hypothetical protein BM564_02235 [Bacteroidetes bacterium MedPE-SWsnd-G2]|nr:MAG: hypothetical protein BM564_02235 [Bacteroidetes bacterium MedPE-SWsnd-G2]
MKSFAYKFAYVSILVFGIFPIFPSGIRGVLIGVLGASALGVLLVEKKFKLSKLVLINSGLLLFYAVSLLWSFDESDSLKKIETALSLIILPLIFNIFSNSSELNFKASLRRNFYWVFTLSSVLMGILIILFFGSLGFFEGIHDYGYCMSHLEREMPVWKDHPIYISINLCISLLFCVNLFNHYKKKNVRWLVFFCVLFLSVILFFLSRKGTIVALLISCLFYIMMLYKGDKFKVIKYSAFVCVASALLLLCIPTTQKRILELFDENTYTTKDETNSTNNRIQIYKCCIELIKEKPIIGYGLGKDKVALHNCYKENLYYLYENKFNSHNQYFGILLKGGIIALLIFLFCLYFNLNLALSHQQYLFGAIVVFYGIAMLSENIIERQNGVILFSFLINFYGFQKFNNQLKQ